jgi:hypothetical protein
MTTLAEQVWRHWVNRGVAFREGRRYRAATLAEHLMRPEIRDRMVANLLAPGGGLAMFWRCAE